MRAFEALAAKSTAVLCERSNIAKEEEEMYYAERPYVSPTSYLPNLVGRGNQLPNFAYGSAPALSSINRRHLREHESGD